MRHKIRGNFEKQTDQLFSVRRPYLVIINKKKRTFRIVDFALTADNRVKLKENEKKVKYLDFVRELRKKVKHESDDYTICN